MTKNRRKTGRGALGSDAGGSLVNRSGGVVFGPDLYRSKRRSGRRHYSVKNIHTRYREQDLNSPLFINKEHGRRILPFTTLGKERFYQNFKLSKTNSVTSGGATLDPSIHVKRCWDQVNPGPPYNTGGPMKLVEYLLPASNIVGYGTYSNTANPNQPNGTYSIYTGGFADDGFWLGDTYSSIRATSPPSNNSLSSFYSRAWDETKPKVPQAGVAQFVYELKDLPGSIETSANAFHRQWKVLGGVDPFNPLAVTIFDPRGSHTLSGKRRRFDQVAVPYMQPKEVADHFLNHNFGWVPFISDIQKIIHVFNNSSELVARIIRDNGRDIRRMRVLEESDTNTNVGVATVSGTFPSSEMNSGADTNFLPYCKVFSNPAGNTKGYCQFNSRSVKRIWAVGNFRYFRPEFGFNEHYEGAYTALRQVDRLMTLYGIRVNPTLIWKITPWTWLADWFTGVGSYLERLDDFVTDGITAKYLYVMKTEVKYITKTCVLNFYSGLLSLNFQRVLNIKVREAADGPYGFNTPWKTLSPRQWAILGAIGISRSSSGYISRGA